MIMMFQNIHNALPPKYSILEVRNINIGCDFQNLQLYQFE